ncbi:MULTISPECIES: hypothetical protein [unclassified Methylobacterium]|jgi:hypothetical protein|uniref:hypothetical protein n=1 Tax=unclassified Methylobacterium TaxID=2615210 RepID=UPI0005BA1FA0|nr:MULTISPECIES: hypothetical protein [unclassified Methylobacterium]SFV12805.1 hypothetical protein SAMN02799643_05779 [Methylobacterium sp. UNCCL125]
MIKRKYALFQTPFDERCYDWEDKSFYRPNGRPKSQWVYRLHEIQESLHTSRGWYVWINYRLHRANTLTEACDRIDTFYNRRAGQRRRWAEAKTKPVRRPLPTVRINLNEFLAEILARPAA